MSSLPVCSSCALGRGGAVAAIAWTAGQGYFWQSQGSKTLKRINLLPQACLRSPFDGIGKPEPLRENLSGFWSRRIDDIHRLVYAVDDKDFAIIACRYHY